MIVLRKQYICDFTGKKSFDGSKFLVLHLYAGREFDGAHQYEDVYETFHIHNSAIKKIVGNIKRIPKYDEYEKQEKLVIKLQKLKTKMRIKHGKIN